MSSAMCRRYLIWFAHEHISFRIAEIESLISLFKINFNIIENQTIDNSFMIVETQSESCLKKLASRSVSIRWCIELWGRSKSYSDIHKNIKQSLTANEGLKYELFQYGCRRKDMEPYFNKTFKVNVETFNKHFTLAEKIQKIDEFSYIPMSGPIRLKNPELELSLIEFYGMDHNNVPPEPYDIFFGRLVMEGQRQLINKLSLKTRNFIGNTSMDPLLSIYTVNQAQISDGDLVLDPFVGTGSLLIAAAEFGGFVWGSDIDYMMLHGRTKPTRMHQKERAADENIISNMKQYKTQNQYMDVVVSDFSMPLWRPEVKFDAIITDPPYGIREPTERIGIERKNYTLTPEQIATHIPSKVEYGLVEIFNDLLEFAALHLTMGRFLVCWFPCTREEYEEVVIPSHGCLKLVANSEQILSTFTSRRLLTYKKIAEPGDNPDSNKENKSGTDFRKKFFQPVSLSRREKRELKQDLGFQKPL